MMGRPREFEKEEAIEKAMVVFWKHGYQDASLPELLEGMGLTRGSLYKAFKDKKNLFLIVLDHYETAAVDVAVTQLTDQNEPVGTTRILSLFAGIYGAVARGEHRGCLMCTAAAGPEMEDPEIAQAVHRGLYRIQQAFGTALNASARHKALSEQERLNVADVLLTQYVGLRVLARSQLPLGILENSVKGIELILR